jgi:metal-sulfur cluster biosynthetic enzyme
MGLELTEESVEEALRDVIDPELGINVLDLGLVYGIHIDSPGADGNYDVVVDMTLTTPACPLTDMIEDQVEVAVKDLGATSVHVQWVWSPAWSTEMITDDGRDQLRMLGFNF